MDRVYKVLCVWMVLAITVLGLVPMAAAQEPGGAEGYASEALAGREFVPPMPGLKEFMQEAGWSEDGISLSADMSAEEAQLNYEAYLAKKLDPKATIPGVTRITPKADAEGAGLLAAPANSRVVVGLVRFQDLDPCTGTLCTILPKGPDDNTTYHIDPDPNLHYRRMLFETPENNPWSMRSYFREASYKSFDLKGDVLGWNNVPRLPQAAAYYGTDPVGGGLDQNLAQFVKDSADRILPLLPTSGHSDTDYGTADVYGTVVLDYFFIVHAGRGQETGGGPLGSKALWSTAGTLSPTHVVRTNNAVFAVKNFVVVAENSPVGVFVHEMGHLFGLPDTWNYSLGVKDPFNYGLGIKPGAPNTGEHDDMPWPDQDYGASGGEASPAFYDPMAQGCWLGMPPGTMPASMTAWERIQLGWLRPYEWSICDWPRPVKLEQINDQHDNRAIKIKLDKSKVYVTPYSGSYMRGAPAPADMTSPSILTHTFQITATGSASLKYQQWYDLEPNADKGYVQVRVSPAGAWSAKVNQVTGNSGGWAGAVLNLNAYVGKTIDVRFVLERDSAIEGLGWFLDDFALEQDGKDTWKDDTELSADGPPQGAGNYTWQRLRFPRREEIASEHYYLLEWRNDGGEYHEIGDSGFDRGLQQVFNWVNASTGHAQYYRYNPGLLIWYVNPIYSDNDVLSHPGEGMILLVDSHPDPLYESTKPWRTRVQMQDATFRQNGKFTYVNQLLDTATPPVLKTMGGLAAVDTFWDKPANKYYRSTIPDNSVKTPGTGLKVKVTLEERAQWGAWLQLSTDGTEITGVKLNDPPDIVEPGDTIEYTIVITNTGLRTCNLSVYDPAPQFATYNVGSLVPPPTGTYTETADGRGSWRWVGTIEANETLTFRFSVTLDPVIMTGTLIINTAYVYEGPTPKAELTATNVVHAEPCLAFSTKTVEWAEWHPNQQGVLPGDLLTYTIALRNTGNMTATAWLTDCLPPCTTLVPGSVGFRPTQLVGAWRFDGQCLYWNSEVPVGGMTPTVWFTFTVKIDPASSACCTQYCSQIINTAYLTDPAACDEFELTATAIVGKGPNLRDSLKRVTNVDPGLAVKPGARLDYEIEIFNAGNESATVVVDDPIPANTTYIDDSMAVRKNGVLVCAGNSCPGEPPPKVYWTGTIGMGDKITVTFSVSVANPLANGTIITNTAVITEKYKHWTKVYERTTQTTVRSEPWFGDGSYKTDQYAGAPATAAYGSVLTYTIVLHNTGTEAAATVFVTDKIPVGTVHDPLVHAKSASMPTVSYNPSIGPLGAILWKGGPIAPGGRVTITFEVSITERLSRIIENVAEVDDGWPTHEHLFLREYTRIAALEVVTPTGDIYCGDAFCVPIWVHNVEDLVGGKVVLAFDDSIIRLVYPPVNNEYLVPPGYPSWFTPILPPYVTPADITHTDIVTVDISLVIGDRPLMVPVGKNGSGDFFWLCFRAVGSGWSYINILESELLHTPMPGYTTIPHNWINGGVTIKDRVISGTVWLEGRNTDNAGGVFVVNSQTGDVLDVSDNYGRYSFCPPAGGGNLQIRLEKDGYLYAEEWITIPVSGVKELSRVMLLGGDPIGRSDWYIIPPTIPMTYPPVTCTEPITTPFKSQNPPNGIVEILDLTFTGSRLGKTPADPNWQATRMPPAEDERCYPYGWYVDPADLDPITMQPKIKAKNHYRADINEDAKVSIQDLVLVGLNFGETAPIDWSP